MDIFCHTANDFRWRHTRESLQALTYCTWRWLSWYMCSLLPTWSCCAPTSDYSSSYAPPFQIVKSQCFEHRSANDIQHLIQLCTWFITLLQAHCGAWIIFILCSPFHGCSFAPLFIQGCEYPSPWLTFSKVKKTLGVSSNLFWDIFTLPICTRFDGHIYPNWPLSVVAQWCASWSESAAFIQNCWPVHEHTCL